MTVDTPGKKRGERGRAQATLDLIGTCHEIIEPRHPITVRGVAYQLFVRELIPSMEKNETKRISSVLTIAREENRIPWQWVVDPTREMEAAPAWANLEEYSETIIQSWRRDFWADQPYRVIVISEKSTVAGLLRPTLDKYGVPFQPVHGWNSYSNIKRLAVAMQKDRRHYVLAYCGDIDPSGLYMSEVDFPGRLKEYGAPDFTFIRIALIFDEVVRLPSFAATDKIKDSRYKWYIQHYGPRCWEIDAMEPNDLRTRVDEHILAYIDPVAWERHKIIEEAQRTTTRRVAAELAAGEGGGT